MRRLCGWHGFQDMGGKNHAWQADRGAWRREYQCRNKIRQKKEGENMGQYNVFHRWMRDAQIYTGDSDAEDVHADKNHDHWKDFESEPLIDVVDAEDEYEAVQKVAQATGCHISNLYAEEHVVSAAGEITVGDDYHAFRIEASRFDDGDLTGIAVTLPDARVMHIALNRLTAKTAVNISDPEGGAAPQVILL